LYLYIWSTAFYVAETWALQKGDQKYKESFEMRCWRRMEISWNHHVRNDEVLQRVKEESNILQTIKRRGANWIGNILHRNCLLKHVMERKTWGRIEVTEDEQEGVGSYWMIPRKREDPGN
jgi:hypothetical protein